MTFPTDDEQNDRARGALLGLAIGDALGLTLEGSVRDAHPKLTDLAGGGRWGLRPGEWTDDTSLALALADSLIACGGFDARDLSERFVRWWREGAYSCTGFSFDIGVTTRTALERFERDGSPLAEATDTGFASNGSIMRLAPAVLFAFRDEVLLRRVAREQSLVTHGASEAVEACVWIASRLRMAILGASKDDVLAADVNGGWREKDRDRIVSSGHVKDTLEAALWCVDRTSSFRDAVLLAVNLGGDADTVGAVTGQLAGALYGYAAIPREWLAKLAWRERIEGMADRLIALGA